MEPISIYTIADVHTVALITRHHANNDHHTHEVATALNEAQKPKEYSITDHSTVVLYFAGLTAEQTAELPDMAIARA